MVAGRIIFRLCAGTGSAAANLAQLVESGQIVVDGHSTPYLIRHLPVSSFPELPATVQELLNRRGCLIPQTYEAYHPENVVHASLERAGSSDWAVLCSAEGTVSLLVFFGSRSASAQPLVLVSAPETERLQAHDASGALGFNWGIDPASPEQVHEAQAGWSTVRSGWTTTHWLIRLLSAARSTIFMPRAFGRWWRCRIDFASLKEAFP
jgi:hypothetical protein